jgi:hypothetical protein
MAGKATILSRVAARTPPRVLGAEKLHDPFCDGPRFHSFALPYRKHVPPLRSEAVLIFLIPLLVPCQFRTPVSDSCLGDVGVLAVGVLVPKAALDLDDFQQPWEDQIGPAGE